MEQGLTVEEFIEKLKKCNPGSIVEFEGADYSYEIGKISESNEKVLIYYHDEDVDFKLYDGYKEII